MGSKSTIGVSSLLHLTSGNRVCQRPRAWPAVATSGSALLPPLLELGGDFSPLRPPLRDLNRRLLPRLDPADVGLLGLAWRDTGRLVTALDSAGNVAYYFSDAVGRALGYKHRCETDQEQDPGDPNGVMRDAIHDQVNGAVHIQQAFNDPAQRCTTRKKRSADPENRVFTPVAQ